MEEKQSSSSSTVPKSDKSTAENEILAGVCFDRLRPRGSEPSNPNKRKRDEDEDEESSPASGISKKWRREYHRLRTLVPALEERGEDLTKIEIIEETIRYIDSLHQQLAERLSPDQQDQGGEARSKSPSENEPNCSVPIRRRSTPATSSTGPTSSAGLRMRRSTPASLSPEQVKARMESIQQMFAAYLSNRSASDAPDEAEETAGDGEASPSTPEDEV